MLTPKDYQDAIDVQGAVNLVAVVHAFSKVCHKIFEEHDNTKDRNQHPICRLYAEQICFLSGAGFTSDAETYNKAYDICVERAK